MAGRECWRTGGSPAAAGPSHPASLNQRDLVTTKHSVGPTETHICEKHEQDSSNCQAASCTVNNGIIGKT